MVHIFTRAVAALIACAALLPFSAVSQIQILENDTSVCLAQPFTFHAITDSGLVATDLNTIDDTYSGAVALGFPFTFYGNTYTQVVLSTNAYLTFNVGNAGGFSPWSIDQNTQFPNPSFPTNAIMAPWHDTYPGAPGFPIPGTVTYHTVGTAPDRKFVFSFCNVPMYAWSSCANLYYTGQIILYEGSNIIETHIGEKVTCTGWNYGQAVHGLHNATGTIAHILPGRNTNQLWDTTNEGTRFTPNGPNDYIIDNIPYAPIPAYTQGSISWLANGTLIGTGNQITHNFPVGVNELVAAMQGCYGSNAADTIYVTVGVTAANYSQQNVECPSATNGFAIVDFLNNNEYSTAWFNSAGQQIGGNTGFLDADTLTNLGPGTYQLVIQDTIGCETIHNFNISSGTYEATVTHNPPVICRGGMISFTNTSNETITHYQWTVDGLTSNDPYLNHVFGQAGEYAVTLQITNSADGCTDDVTVTVLVHELITADFDHAGSYCVGEPVSFTDQSSPFPVQWAWSFGNGSVALDRNPIFAYNTSGAYNVTLVSVDSLCGIDTVTKTVVINYFPDVQLQHNDTVVCAGHSLTFNAGNPGDSYSWNLGGSGQVQTFVFQQSGQVMVTVNHEGCVTSDTVNIIVDCFLDMPNAFTPNGDNLNDRFRPWGRNVNSYEMQVYDRWGKLIYTTANGMLGSLGDGWDGRINGKDAEVGVYAYRVRGTLMDNSVVERSGSVTLVR